MTIQIESISGTILFAATEVESLRDAAIAAVKARVNLSGADLSGASLSNADLSGAILSHADLSGANLSRANLSSELRGADLSGAVLDGANLIGAKFSPTQVLSCNWSNISDGLRADLMALDASAHPDRTKFDAWAKGGDCPYRDLSIRRIVNFQERRELWGKGKQITIWEAVTRLFAEKNVTWV